MAFGCWSRIHVALHRPVPVAPEDWEAYFRDIELHLPSLEGLFVVAPHGGDLTGEQRRFADKFWASKPTKRPISVVTDARLVRVIANVFSSLLGNPIRAFALGDFDAACEHLKLRQDQREEARRAARELAQLLGEPPPW